MVKKLAKEVLKNVIKSSVWDFAKIYEEIWHLNLYSKAQYYIENYKNPLLFEKLKKEIEREGKVKVIITSNAEIAHFNIATNEILISPRVQDNPFLLAHEYAHAKFNIRALVSPPIFQALSTASSFVRVLSRSAVFHKALIKLASKLKFPPQKTLFFTLIGPYVIVLIDEIFANLYAVYKLAQLGERDLGKLIILAGLSFATYLNKTLFDIAEYVWNYLWDFKMEICFKT